MATKKSSSVKPECSLSMEEYDRITLELEHIQALVDCVSDAAEQCEGETGKILTCIQMASERIDIIADVLRLADRKSRPGAYANVQERAVSHG